MVTYQNLISKWKKWKRNWTIKEKTLKATNHFWMIINDLPRNCCCFGQILGRNNEKKKSRNNFSFGFFFNLTMKWAKKLKVNTASNRYWIIEIIQWAKIIIWIQKWNAPLHAKCRQIFPNMINGDRISNNMRFLHICFTFACGEIY